MRRLKRLTRNQKKFLAEQGYNPDEFLIEHRDAWSYRFYNIHTKQLMEFRY